MVTRISVGVPPFSFYLSFLPTLALILWVFFSEYAEANPVSQAAVPLMDRDGKGRSLERQIRNKQNGIGRQDRPYVGQ